MKKFLKIFLGVLFAALLLGTFVFLWQKTRPVKVVYTIVQPKLDTLKQFVVATGKAHQAPDFGHRLRRLQGGRPDGAQGRGDRHG